MGRTGLAINSGEVMDPLLDEYYALHGWDVSSGRPTRAVLESLDLGRWADELARWGCLPGDARSSSAEAVRAPRATIP
jgi:hypothetical protein